MPSEDEISGPWDRLCSRSEWAVYGTSSHTVWEPLAPLPPLVLSPLPFPGSEVEQGPALFPGSGVKGSGQVVYTFVLDVKLSLLPEASEGRDTSAWANQDARHLGVSRQVEARGTGQKETEVLPRAVFNPHDGTHGRPGSHLRDSRALF